jgi:hypothetical protein
MGPLQPRSLPTLPFAWYEILTGVREAATGRLRRIPMLGYEADTGLRAPIVRLWNALNRRQALRTGWLRIGIHPGDLGLPLADDLRADLTRFPGWTSYEALGRATGTP